LFHIISTLNKLFAVFFIRLCTLCRIASRGEYPTPSKTRAGNARAGEISEGETPGVETSSREMSVSRALTVPQIKQNHFLMITLASVVPFQYFFDSCT